MYVGLILLTVTAARACLQFMYQTANVLLWYYDQSWSVLYKFFREIYGKREKTAGELLRWWNNQQPAAKAEGQTCSGAR